MLRHNNHLGDRETATVSSYVELEFQLHGNQILVSRHWTALHTSTSTVYIAVQYTAVSDDPRFVWTRSTNRSNLFAGPVRRLVLYIKIRSVKSNESSFGCRVRRKQRRYNLFWSPCS